jgi:hypothetical protein
LLTGFSLRLSVSAVKPVLISTNRRDAETQGRREQGKSLLPFLRDSAVKELFVSIRGSELSIEIFPVKIKT